MPRELVIPELLTSAMANPNWPVGRVSGSRLRTTHTIFESIDFELLRTADQLRRNGIADTETLIEFAKTPSTRDHVGLAIGSTEKEHVLLPRLDVEQILVFGGGADFGDDFWLTLDFRSDTENPRVVGNQFRFETCEWFIITKTFRDFCAILDIALP